MRRLVELLTLFAVLLGTEVAHAQECPREDPNGPTIPSAVRTLQGEIVYHDGIRQWFGLRLVAPVCGVRDIELIHGWTKDEKPDAAGEAIMASRGCRATVTGALAIPVTGYYSAPIYIPVDHIEAGSDCVRKRPLPDFSSAKPDGRLRRYRVTMHIDYRRGDHPVTAQIRAESRVVTPWQRYASYYLTGGFTLYAYCADGFAMSGMSGTPEGKPWMIDNYLAFDPETAAAKHVSQQYLRYTCTRDPAAKKE